MGSIICATKCPNCGRSAIQDYYYRSDEKTIVCYRCGFYLKRQIQDIYASPTKYKEERYDGYGVFRLVNKDGKRTTTIFSCQLKENDIEKYVNEFSGDAVNQEKSFLVTYTDGDFKILCGTPTENWHLPFEAYKKKMLEKYGDTEDNRHMVPIEE
ncbi:hypothetical protein [Sporosarcina ureilytica]|uniref:Uncharacterized protein n=1 Tax=Sporosarcina ureilytica TaxID=298596 RepID=A0A1D8JF44_9BACL|nr:hypothetical protein [Sporosarcina ureilytica]AOV07334.1 hypothetical protein BI350_07125 [Sporosarcina ureilytica]